MNYLKTERKVDTYIPLRKNMTAYEMAVSTAKYIDEWNNPNSKRKAQHITLIRDLGKYWESDIQMCLSMLALFGIKRKMNILCL